MIVSILQQIFRFLLLLVIQILVLNNITLPGIFNSYIYFYFIITLPIAISHTLLLFISFLCGLGVDVFSGTLGIHAFAATFLGFLRPYLLTILKPSGGYNSEDEPRLFSLGFRWFFIYSLYTILIAHFILFLVETLSVNQLLLILSKTIMSSILSVVIIILIEYLLYSRKK